MLPGLHLGGVEAPQVSGVSTHDVVGVAWYESYGAWALVLRNSEGHGEGGGRGGGGRDELS